MGAAREKICSGGIFQPISLFLQQGQVAAQGGRIAGNIDDPAGGHFVQRFDGVGVEALSGRIHDDNIRDNTLGFQLQRCLARITAEKLRIFNAVTLCIVLSIRNCLLHHFHTDHLAGCFCHGKGDGAYTAVQIQHQIILGDLRLRNGRYGFTIPGYFAYDDVAVRFDK